MVVISSLIVNVCVFCQNVCALAFICELLFFFSGFYIYCVFTFTIVSSVVSINHGAVVKITTGVMNKVSVST